jgi:hypothetical protein
MSLNPITAEQNSFTNQLNTGFNPLTHVPPKYDIYGRLKKQYNYGGETYNILAEKDKIKIPWQHSSSENPLASPMTRSKLIERRKKERIPDISYDLDKDGYVGGKDYVLAKRYDLDNDGKLNEQEKAAAYEGIKNNVEENYVWNLDNQGGNRAFRIMQKRGKIIDAENFLPLRDTFPVHPLSTKIPKNGIKTLQSLREYRKEQTKNEINDKIKLWEEKNPTQFVNEPILGSDNLKNQPLYKSMNEVKNALHKEARKRVGLDENESDIKITNKDPTLAYVYNPKHKTQKDLEADLHRENMEQSNKLAQRPHKNDLDRLNEREDEIFAKLYKSSNNGMTYTKLKEQRKQEVSDYNLKHFSHHAVGVHGQELPKFAESENMKEFWKFKDGYCENPRYQSQVDLKESHKFWKKPEELLLLEHKDEVPKQDVFKREKVLPEKKDDLVIKVNQVNFYKDFDPAHPKPIDITKPSKNHIYRWTSLVHQFAPQKFKNGRMFDVIPEAVEKVEKEVGVNFGGFPDNTNKVEKIEEDKPKIEEPVINLKMPLFQKFSNKDEVKLMKSSVARSKAF